MTEISTIIRARLDEGRTIADEDVRALLNENEKLRAALEIAPRDTLDRAAKALDGFGDSIWHGSVNHRVPRCILTIGDCALIVRSLIEKEQTND
jgi:hypothetical protein